MSARKYDHHCMRCKAVSKTLAPIKDAVGNYCRRCRDEVRQRRALKAGRP
jgi:hypothetical protein